MALLLLIFIRDISITNFHAFISERTLCLPPFTTNLFCPLDRSSGYYYGSTSLSFWGKRGSIVRNTWRLRHSLLQFRGIIFEWGIKRNGVKTYDMGRSLSDCKIKWSYSKKGYSRCLSSDAQRWTRAYRGRYGKYRLFSNNCHHYVNKLGRYLATNCGR